MSFGPPGSAVHRSAVLRLRSGVPCNGTSARSQDVRSHGQSPQVSAAGPNAFSMSPWCTWHAARRTRGAADRPLAHVSAHRCPRLPASPVGLAASAGQRDAGRVPIWSRAGGQRGLGAQPCRVWAEHSHRTAWGASSPPSPATDRSRHLSPDAFACSHCAALRTILLFFFFSHKQKAALRP